MGLSQLCQLEDVSDVQIIVYAALTYHRMNFYRILRQKTSVLVKEFTEFGSGFKIAMRDLEIRGAGNIAGPELSTDIWTR